MVLLNLITGAESNSASSSSVTTTSTKAMEVDYDNGPTRLYMMIQERKWTEAISRIRSHRSEASTWVYRMDKNKNKTRWKILPLHAALVFNADISLIQALIDAYPNSVKQVDDQGMTPVSVLKI